MRRSLSGTVVLSASVLIATFAIAQKPIPVRSLSPAVGTDSGVLLDAMNIRPLVDGRVIVNDRFRERLVLFDQTLQRFTTIAGSGDGAQVPWLAGTVILSYPGDSTAMLDWYARAFVLIDPKGTVTRTFALPNALDVSELGPGVIQGGQAFDSKGRLVIQKPRTPPPGRNSPPLQCSGVFWYWTSDSGTVIRGDPETRTTDTLGLFHRITSKRWKPCQNEDSYNPLGGTTPFPFMPTADEWTMLSDGTVAIVRGHDYHIDWIAPDGKVTSSPKMAFDWLRITSERKQYLADSLNAAANDRRAAAAATPPPPPPPGRPSYKRPTFVWEADAFPDYYPPIRVGTVKSDPEGNVWLLTTTSVLAAGGLVYDVVNRKGEIVERVKFPPDRKLIAVGKDGVVYMSYTPKGLVRLERATVIR